MVTLNDKYIPIEGINFSFTEIENCELEARPSRVWYKWKDFWFRKRDGIATDVLWRTQGNLKWANFFNNNIYSYTDAWFVYTFDGSNMTSVSAVAAATVTQAAWNTDLAIDESIPQSRQWQEFTATQNSVIRSVTVSLKRVWTFNASDYIRLKLTSAADKNTIIATSQDSFSCLLLWLTYWDFTFNFNNVYLPNGTQYFLYVEVDNTDATNYVDVEAQTGNPYAGWASFFYDWTTWTQNGTTDMTFTVDMTWALYYDNRFSEDTTIVSYLWWGRYPNSSVTRTINTYNNTTWEITVTVALPWAVWDFITKYVYVQTGTWAKQYSLISNQTSSTSITAGSLFDVDPVPWDTIVFYNSIEPQLLIPQLRRGSGTSDVTHLYSISRSGQSNFWSFSNSKKLIFWDNRIVSLALNGQALSFHDLIYIEIPTVNTIVFGNEAAYDVADFGSYLVCFFANKIWVVRKITNTTTGTVTYSYQDLVSTGIYSEKAYLIKASDLYIFSTDKRLYSVDISTLTINELSADLKDQWDILENYFDKFEEWWEVTFNYTSWILRLIYKFNGATEVYKYIDWYQVWVRDTYQIAGNLLGWLYNINDERVTCYNNNFVRFQWIQDLGVNINQRIKIYGPEEGKLSTFTLLKTKLRIWFDYENMIGWRLKLQIWGYHLYNRYYDLNTLEIIQEINQVISSKWLIWEPLVAQYTIWWEIYSEAQLKDIYPEFIDVWFNVWKKWQYFTMEITNNEEKQLYLNAINPLYNTESLLVISNKWVMPGE